MKICLTIFIFLLSFNINYVQAQNPILWGISGGGQGGVGNIFQTNATGSEFKSDFSFTIKGDYPSGDVIQASNGLLYGMTSENGANGGGIIFSYDTSTGIETDLYDFGNGTDGRGPDGSFIQANNGLLYGMTSSGGKNNEGTIFSYNITTGEEINLYDFGNGTDGFGPNGSLIQASNGLLYGVTEWGGANEYGIIFSFNITTRTETKTHDFGNGTDGSSPYGSLIEASNGLLYGMTMYGGTNYSGTIFSYDISTESETDIHDFRNGADGIYPNGTPFQASNGLLYGMTDSGGIYNAGIIFSYNISTGKEVDLHNFGNGTDGTVPYGSFIQAGNGFLYGTTSGGGTKGDGTIFSYTISTGSESDLYDFASGAKDGAYPLGSLIQASNGFLYGMDIQGGANNGGIIFSYDISKNKEADLYDFGGNPDGYSPGNSLILATNGLLYGMTNAGGTYGYGTIFSYNISTGLVTNLYDFGDDTDGKVPLGSFIQASNGLLYGMTYEGGHYGRGIIFSYNISTGVETILHQFNSEEGYNPYGSLIQASNGLLYGMTSNGGANFAGVVFSYNISSGIETIVHVFGYGYDGQTPYGSLIQASDSLLYGMTSWGGGNGTSNYGDGVIFSFNISRDTEKVVYDFGSSDSDGLNPFGSLIQASDGLLYGTTYEGSGYGNIFSYNISTSVENNLYTFIFGTGGFLPGSDLMQASNNLLYGMNSDGGANYDGTIFSYDISTGIEKDIHDFSGIDGDDPSGSLIEDNVTGINQLSINANRLSIYPNPTSNFIHVIQNLQQEESVQLSLYNILGHRVWAEDLGNIKQVETSIPVTYLANGVYVLRVYIDGASQQKEVVVAR